MKQGLPIVEAAPRELKRFGDLEAERLRLLARRRSSMIYALMFGGGVFLLGMVWMIWMGNEVEFALPLLFIWLAIGFAVGWVGFYRQVANDVAKFAMVGKTRVIGDLLKEIAPGLRYSPGKGVARTTFERSGLYSGNVDRYSTEDGFFGDVGDTGVLFAHVCAEERRVNSNTRGGTRTSYSTIFKGVFFIADFHKDFRSPVLVTPDVAGRLFGAFGRSLRRMISGSLQLENPEFNRAFVVRGEDPVEVRYILTPDMQQRLLVLRERFGNDVRIAFRESCLIAALPGAGTDWDISLHKPVDCRFQLARLEREIRVFVSLVEALNLNTRIWTKV